MKALSRVALELARRLPRGYWRVTRFAARRDPAIWDLPLPLRYLPNEIIRADLREPVFTAFLRHGCFPHQVGEDLVCSQLLRPGDVVFDIGANIGYPTLLFANLVGPTGKVIALEPSARAYRLLSRTTSTWANIQRLNIAASDREGESIFFETESLDTSSLIPIVNAKSYPVPTTRLDRLAEEVGKPDFVKIDVEGFEPMVFTGMSGLFDSVTPPIVLFEALSCVMLSRTLSAFHSLTSGRYSLYRVMPAGTLADVQDPGGTNNYLAAPGWSGDRFTSELVV